jgi:hypothetical protein
VNTFNYQAAQQVGILSMFCSRPAGVWALVDGLQSYQSQALRALAIHHVALAAGPAAIRREP